MTVVIGLSIDIDKISMLDCGPDCPEELKKPGTTRARYDARFREITNLDLAGRNYVKIKSSLEERRQ
jgi:hypothetical protein